MIDRAERPAIHPAPPVLVRPARRAEYDAIRTLLSTGYHGYTTDIDSKVWPAYLADLLDLDRHARHGELLVAVIDGDIAGYAAFYPDASVQRLGWPAGWAGGRGLVVHPDYRGSASPQRCSRNWNAGAMPRGRPRSPFTPPRS